MGGYSDHDDYSSVVVDDFDFIGPCFGPGVADPVLTVDPNTELPPAVAGEDLESVARRHPEIIETLGGVELLQFPHSH